VVSTTEDRTPENATAFNQTFFFEFFSSLNFSSSKHLCLVEEANDLAGNVLSTGLLVVHDTSRGGEDDVAELTGRQQLDNPVLEVGETDVVAGGDDTSLVETAVQLNDNLAVAVVIDLLELANVACKKKKNVSKEIVAIAKTAFKLKNKTKDKNTLSRALWPPQDSIYRQLIGAGPWWHIKTVALVIMPSGSSGRAVFVQLFFLFRKKFAPCRTCNRKSTYRGAA